MDPATTAETVVKRLEDAWNAADGAAFGAPFAPDADFVTIRGELHSGEAIATGHQQIFDTIYAGSTVRYACSGRASSTTASSSPTCAGT